MKLINPLNIISRIICLLSVIACAGTSFAVGGGAKDFHVDVCVYGGTPAGITAAVAAAKQGKSVLLVEPSRWLGGMMGAGIRPAADCTYRDFVGGLTKELQQKSREIGGVLENTGDRANMVRDMFKGLLGANGVEVLYEHRLHAVKKTGQKIEAITLDYAPPQQDGCPAPEATKSESVIAYAKVFIDASCEGDLMAMAGVSYVGGRESREQYGESLAGQRNLRVFDISPYIIPDDPTSGLLPLIDPEPYKEGAASRATNGYNFRIRWNAKEGKLFGVPSQYDPAKYELVRRALAADRKMVGWPTDNYKRTTLISGGIPGRQSDYPEADWAERSKIWREFIDFDRVLNMLTGNRSFLQEGEYPDNGDFPAQFYIRLARRMLGRYVMTQHDLAYETKIDDSIGLGGGWKLKVDIYPCRIVATPDGKVATEGETLEDASPGPYPISYRSITPKVEQCSNLLVPVCISASHVALSSIRMQDTYAIMGESAGIAAAQAINENCPVQDIDMAAYRQALLKAGQILDWDGTGKPLQGWPK